MILVAQVLLYLSPNSRHDDTTMTAMGVGLARLRLALVGSSVRFGWLWMGKMLPAAEFGCSLLHLLLFL